MKPNSRSKQPAANEYLNLAFSRKHILGIILAVIGLICIALGGFASRDRNEKSAESSEPPVAPVRAEGPRRVLNPHSGQTWQWPDSGAATYQIRHAVDLAPGDSEMSPQTVGLTVIESKLHVALASADESSVTLAMQLGDTSFTVDPTGDEPPRREPIIERLLDSHAGLLHLGRDGRVLGCRLPAALADGDRAMLEGMLSVHFVLGEGSRWESGEEIQGFRFLSSYQTTAGQAVLKSRHVQTASGNRPTLRILTSRTNATPGAFWIEKLDGQETLHYLWKDRVVCTAKTTASMQRIAPAEMPNGLLALMQDPAMRDALIDSAILSSKDDVERASAIERQRIARLVEIYQSVPASRMIDDLIKAVADAKDHEDTIPAIHALRDWLLANPSASGEIAAALATPGMSDGAMARIAHALQLAGKTSVEAQTALASVIKSTPGTFPKDAILKSVVAAGGVGRVLSAELMPALSDLATAETHAHSYELSNSALFALGSLARENPALKDSLVDTLSLMLDKAGEFSAEDTTTALLTLANARIEDPEIMQKAITLGKSHGREDVRMAAIDLLSASSQPQAVEAVRQSMANDSSEAVRRHAITALTRPETTSAATIRPVIDFLDKSRVQREIDHAISSLAPLHEDFPEIREALGKQLPNASGESSEIIRQVISQAR